VRSIDRVFSMEGQSREAVLNMAKSEAMDRAREAGARPETIKVIDIEEVPLAYLPGSATRIRVKAVGDLAIAPAPVPAA